jgi:PAT family beta-lactamase induction signal transducer AmpG
MTNPTIFESIFNKRMLICIFTGFSSGLPLYVLIQLVPAWLREEDVSLAEIGLFTLVGLPYVLKFLWSPVLDRFTLPFLGRRRGWMLVTQFVLLVSITALGTLNPKLSIWTIAYLAAAMAFFSATQDIVLDAFRREILQQHEFGLGNAIHVQAYRFSGVVAGGLGLVLADHLPWDSIFKIVGAFMLIGIVFTLVVDEAEQTPNAPKTMQEAVVHPFVEFFQRKGSFNALNILAFMFLYKLGDSMATALQTPFFIDMGFSLTEIGVVAKFTALTASIVGGLLGGIIMIKLSINRALWIFGFVQITSILGFAALSVIGNNIFALGFANAFEYLGVGLGTAAFTAFIFKQTNLAFAATQIALFTALTALPRTVATTATGFIVEAIGWTSFFMLCILIAIPGMLMLFKVAPWNEPDEAIVEKNV